MEYPRSIVWFIRAEEDGKPPSEGSAVAVRLQRKGSLGDVGKLYLLTCSHVIRKGKGNDKEFGPCYKRIRAWASGWSFSEVDPKSGAAVSPVQDIIPTESNSSDFWQRPVKLDGHADWVLLQFDNRSVAETFDLPSLREWNEDGINDARACSIIGYPGGSTRFTPPNWNVEPTLGFDEVPVVRQESGLNSFEGIQTREGMSGGGVFETGTQELVGLHRSRHDLAMNLQAVSMVQVSRVLREKYSLKPDKRITSRPWLKIVLASAALMLTVAVLILASATLSGRGTMPKPDPHGDREVVPRVTTTPDTVACRVFDSLTNDEIRREVTLKTETQSPTFNFFSGDQVPRDLFADRVNLKVKSLGFMEIPSSIFNAPSGKDTEHIVLDRNPDLYAMSISPNGTLAGLPSYEELRRERQLNRPLPGKVRIFVKNKTGHRPDVILLCDQDPDSPTAKPGRTDFDLPVTILADQILENKVTESSAVLDTPNLVAALYLSFHGKPVEYMRSCEAVYQAPFLIIHVLSYIPPEAQIEFSEESPIPTL